MQPPAGCAAACAADDTGRAAACAAAQPHRRAQPHCRTHAGPNPTFEQLLPTPTLAPITADARQAIFS